MKVQLMQQAARMEYAHYEITTALIKARLTDERQKLKRGSIQQYRARVVKLRRTLQEPRPGGEVPKQIKGQCQHSDILTEQHNGVASNHHEKRVSARIDQRMQESQACVRVEKERAARALEHRQSVQRAPSSQRGLRSRILTESIRTRKGSPQ